MEKRVKRNFAGRVARLLTAAVMICLGACGSGNNKPQDPIDPSLAADEVLTDQGVYRGAMEGNLRVFRGLRYAAPPVGNLRFKAPAAPASFAGTSDATAFKANCFQPANSGSAGEEDCLFLNIWSHNDTTVRPVLVFLHGGGSNNIGGNLATSDGATLAVNGDIIVATMNRRMNVFGALALQELILESPRSTAGNYAVQDVQAAMQWLRDNVEQFNGDPDRIMLIGESAGASLLCYILSSPDTAGLISAAVIQSGRLRCAHSPGRYHSYRYTIRQRIKPASAGTRRRRMRPGRRPPAVSSRFAGGGRPCGRAVSRSDGRSQRHVRTDGRRCRRHERPANVSDQ